MKKYNFLFILLLVALTSCADFLVRKQNNRYTPGISYKYSEFQTAINSFEPDYALKFAYDDETKSFTKGFKLMINGELDSSLSIMKNIYNATHNEYLKNCSHDCLFNIYMLKNDYNGIYNLSALKDTLNSNKIFEEIIKYKVSIDFPVDCDTLKLYNGYSGKYIKMKYNNRFYNIFIDLSKFETILFDSLGYYNDIIKDISGSDAIDNEKALYRAIGKNISIGKFNFKNFVFLRNLKFKKYLPDNATVQMNGVIGWEFLRNFDFIIDENNSRLILKKPIRKFNPSRNLIDFYVPLVRFVNNKGLNTYFSFNNSFTFFFHNLKPKLNSKEFSTKNRLLTDGKRNYLGVVDEVNSYFLNEKNYVIELYDKFIIKENRFYEAFLVDGSLGQEIMNEAVLHFDATNGIFEILDN